MTKSTRSGNAIDGAGLLRSATSCALALALTAALAGCGGGSDDDLANALGSTGLQRSANTAADARDAAASEPAVTP